MSLVRALVRTVSVPYACRRRHLRIHKTILGIRRYHPVGIEKDDDYTFDVSYSSGITFGGGSYGTTSMVTEFDNDTQMELNFPMNEDEEYANAGLTDEQMKHIEENTLSTPLSEYEAIENLSYSKEHIKQMQDPRHNQWGIAGEPKKTDD